MARLLGLMLALVLSAGPCGLAAGETGAVKGAGQAAGARPVALLGSLSGVVMDVRGVPQVGAVVALLAGDGKPLHKVLSNERGGFQVERLLPGVYSLQVTLANFLPTSRDHILIQPGAHAFLSINLSSLSDVLSALSGNGPARPEDDTDWKWVVRSSGATRPVLRYTPGPAGAIQAGAFCRDCRGQTQVAWQKPEYRMEFLGGSGRSSSLGSEADFNTAFSFAQSLFSNTTLMLSGNVGYERRTPATAFRGALRRRLPNGSAPEVSVTVRQIFVPSSYAARAAGRDENLQSLSLSYEDSAALGQALRFEYGVLYDSIGFLDRLNTVSPYGRVILQATPDSSFQVFYTAGTPRVRLPGSDPLREIASQLAIFPRLSVRDGAPTVQGGRHVEAGFQHKFSPNSLFQVAAYREDIFNLAVSAALNGVEPDNSEFLPDLFTRNYSFNSGSYHTTGARAAYQQRLGDNLQATVAYSYAGVLAPERNVLFSQSMDELRNILRMERRHALAVKFGALVPVTKTRISAGYKWTLGRTVSAGDIYDESFAQAEPNLNIVIRQPLPSLLAWTSRVEALADFRNLLAQGYVPIVTADGKRFLLVQNVRSFRGGFSVNF